MHAIPFTDFFQRIAKAAGIETQIQLAEALGVNRSAVTQAKLRNAVPPKWILALARKYTLSPDWLEFGKGDARPASVKSVKAAVEKSIEPPVEEIIRVPKVSATLCAGGGSFEVEAATVAEHPFPRAWLARMGTPSAMVFMDVMGDSMEPSIFDGDTVLVDRSATALVPHGILAVGVEDAIYIKRVEKRSGGIVLHSDNPTYSDMELHGDELESFHIIGKVVWLCRDCRFA